MLPVIFLASWQVIMPVLLRPWRTPGEFLVANTARIPADSVLVASNNVTAAVCWFCNRDDVLIVGSHGEYDYGLSHEDSKHRLLNAERLGHLIEDNAGKKSVVFCTDARQYEEYAAKLPKPICRTVGRGLVLAQFTMSGTDPNGRIWP